MPSGERQTRTQIYFTQIVKMFSHEVISSHSQWRWLIPEVRFYSSGNAQHPFVFERTPCYLHANG